MTNPAYYNEHDKSAAAWLRELIKAGMIAPGDVDERSIEDVLPSDLAGYTQCHFFAGIGVWSYSLRRAGWPDDRPVWTGSCPCQPFSQAGEGLAFADERHLWPAFFHLIGERRPAAVIGEQVASKDADPWIDLVQDDMEALDYAFGAVAFPSAGIGAPHIRDRIYWGGLANTYDAGSQGRAGVRQRAIERFARTGGVAGGMADMSGERCGKKGGVSTRPEEWTSDDGAANRPSPTNGHWRDADWIGFRDGKWRPVEPGTFPLVDGPSKGVVQSSNTGLPINADKTGEGRVMRLRGYGNAINAVAAQMFVECFMEIAA